MWCAIKLILTFVQILTIKLKPLSASAWHDTFLTLIFFINIFFLTFLSLDNQQNNKSNLYHSICSFPWNKYSHYG